jgi:transposase
MSEHALLLLPQLRLLDDQRTIVRDRLKTLLETMAAAEDPSGCAVSDAAVIQSIPGVGPAITAALLAEASDAIRNRDYYALRAYGGTAPITRQSGKTRQVSMRRGCNRRVRNALYQWARCSILYDPRSRAHYDQLRQAGHCHSRALRGVADRLLAMLVAMLRKHELYSVSNRLAAQTAAQ